MTDEINQKKGNLVRFELKDISQFKGGYLQVPSCFLILPFLKPNPLAVYQIIFNAIQKHGKSKISISYEELIFFTNTSKSTVQRAITQLEKLGLLEIHARQLNRDVNSYSMPDFISLLKIIRSLNLNYTEMKKPNERISQIKKFIKFNQHPYKQLSDENKKETDKENKKQNKIDKLKPLTKGTIQVPTRIHTEDFWHLLRECDLDNVYTDLKHLTEDLTEEKILAYADVAYKKGETPNVFFKHLVINRDHSFANNYVDPLTRYRKKMESKKLNDMKDQQRKKTEEELILSEDLKKHLKESKLFDIYLDYVEKSSAKFTELNFNLILRFIALSYNESSNEGKKENFNTFQEQEFIKILASEDILSFLGKLESEKKNLSINLENLLKELNLLEIYFENYEKMSFPLTESLLNQFMGIIDFFYSIKNKESLTEDIISFKKRKFIDFLIRKEDSKIIAEFENGKKVKMIFDFELETGKKLLISENYKNNLIESNLVAIYLDTLKKQKIDLCESDFNLFIYCIPFMHEKQLKKGHNEEIKIFREKLFVGLLTDKNRHELLTKLHKFKYETPQYSKTLKTKSQKNGENKYDLEDFF